VEAAGVCGADVGLYNQDLSPRVLGYENVGVVAAIGRVARERWDVQEGERVAIGVFAVRALRFLPAGVPAPLASMALLI
jgi:D-arabinose 1-dehydrogenase-like Zn-dependent alcohol dehydrogenase